MENSHHHDVDYDDGMVSLEEPDGRHDFETLGKWILQMQDGDIEKSDFHKFEHCLLTDPIALDYYIEFMWIFTGLHILLNKKQMPSFTASHSSVDAIHVNR
jgi:hypothetical protein